MRIVAFDIKSSICYSTWWGARAGLVSVFELVHGVQLAGIGDARAGRSIGPPDLAQADS